MRPIYTTYQTHSKCVRFAEKALYRTNVPRLPLSRKRPWSGSLSTLTKFMYVLCTSSKARRNINTRQSQSLSIQFNSWTSTIIDSKDCWQAEVLTWEICKWVLYSSKAPPPLPLSLSLLKIKKSLGHIMGSEIVSVSQVSVMNIMSKYEWTAR